MERIQKNQVITDLKKKLVLLSGPRQAGKTTLAKSLFPSDLTEYLNYDSTKDRHIILKESWSRSRTLIIFDELHKRRQWKSWIKGIFDTEGPSPQLLVTGSARLDVLRRGGESLAGRYHAHRLHPLSVSEVCQAFSSEDPAAIEQRILRFGGFPEPFFGDSEVEAERWRRSHIDAILREDLIDLENVRDIQMIDLLVELLSRRVGSPVSYSSLARDLAVAPNTVKNWIGVLERLFVIFIVTPYTRKIARAILKEPKIYFFDTGRVAAEGGARFENLVATALLKRNHFLEDSRGEKRSLHYVRDQQKREVDFLTVAQNRPEWLIEAKTGDHSLSPSLKHFHPHLTDARCIQLVHCLGREEQYGAIQVLKSAPWLAQLEI